MTLVPSNHDNGYGQAVTHYQPGPAPVLPAQFAPAPAKFSQWIEDARQLAPIAESLARTSFVPKAFFGKPAEVTAAILAGQEVGFGPMAALRSIDVIEGKPGMSAIALRALVQSHGHDIRVVESTATRAIVKGRRKGAAHDESSTWTLDRAAQLGLTSKSNWKNQPTNMLLARATSECARLVAADVILGMPYSSEELLDGIDGESVMGTEAVVEEKPARRTAKRKPLERMEGAEPPLPPARVVVERTEPVVDEPVSAPPAVVDVPDRRLMAAMFATFNDANLKEKDDQLRFIAEVIGRTIESRTELTAPEVRAIIDAAKPLVPPSGGES